jgi:hypothetical protein
MPKAGVLLLMIVLAACDVFRGGNARPTHALSEREFVEIYVALAKARTPEAKAEILKQHGTSVKELESFVQAYSGNLPAMSAVFDSVVARQGMQTDVPALPR